MYSNLSVVLTLKTVWVKDCIGTLTVSDKKMHVSPSPVPCDRFPISKTWSLKSPVGFLFHNKWLPIFCSNTIEDSVTAYNKCLQNRHFQMFGDSTLRQWLLFLEKMLNFVTIGKFRQHRPIVTVNKQFNSAMFWYTHGYPFLHPTDSNNKAFSKPPHVYLDKLPKGCNNFIIINLYLHFNVYSPDVLQRQAHALVKSIHKLLERSPNVTIAFKGFHSFRDGTFYLDDYWASVYDVIIRREFASLRDNVIYLDCWDITMSTENKDFHNPYATDREMVHNILNLMCR